MALGKLLPPALAQNCSKVGTYAAAAKPAMLAKLEHASPQDATIASFMSGSPVSKVVIIINTLLTSAFEAILKALQVHKLCDECHIFCSFSEDAHVLEAGFEGNAYQQFANSVQQALQRIKQQQQQSQLHQAQHAQHAAQDMDGGRTEHIPVNVTVQYFPLHVCPLTELAFVLPASAPSTAARFGDKLAGYSHFGKLPQVQHTQTGSDDEGSARRADLRLLAHSLVGFAAQHNLRLDTFAMGSASRALGDEICPLSPPVGPNGSIPSTPASIILIDRQLDIVTPALHQEHVLDCIFGQLPSSSIRSSNHFKKEDPHQAKPSQHQDDDSQQSEHKVLVRTPAAAVEAGAEGAAPQPEVHTQAGATETAQIAQQLTEGAKAADARQAAHAQHQSPQNLRSPVVTLRSADVKVPLTVKGIPTTMHGSVLGSAQAREWLHFLMGQQPRDALLYLRKWLKDAARKEGAQLKGSRSKLTDKAAIAEDIKGWTEALMAKPAVMLRQYSILQLAWAALHSITGDSATHWATLDKQEQRLMQLATEGTEGLVNAVIDMLRSLKDRPAEQIQLQDAVLLLSTAFCLAARHKATEGPVASHEGSPWQPDQDHAIKDALVDALLQSDCSNQPMPAWLQDLPQRIHQHQIEKQQWHSSAQTDRQEEEQDEEAKDETQNAGSSLYYEGQQLRLELEECVEQLLAQMRDAAALQARTQDRLQRSVEATQAPRTAATEQLPLLPEVTSEETADRVEHCIPWHSSGAYSAEAMLILSSARMLMSR